MVGKDGLSVPCDLVISRQALRGEVSFFGIQHVFPSMDAALKYGWKRSEVEGYVHRKGMAKRVAQNRAAQRLAEQWRKDNA